MTYCLPHGLEYVKENKSKVRNISSFVMTSLQPEYFSGETLQDPLHPHYGGDQRYLEESGGQTEVKELLPGSIQDRHRPLYNTIIVSGAGR